VSLHRLVAAVAVAAGVAVGATLAHAAANGGLVIDGVDVEQVAEIAEGVPLRFSVYGTPHATVMLRVEGGWRVLALEESTPGVYEGTYVVDARDAVRPGSRVTATIQQGGRLARADLDEPLLLGRVPLPWADAAQTVGGRGSPAPTVVAPLTPPPQATAPRSAPAQTTAPRPSRSVPMPEVVARGPERVTCDDCARVESVRMVDAAPGGAFATLPDRVARAVLGDELGQAHTERMRRLLGTVTGRQPTRAAISATEYEVVLRTSDGRRQVWRYDQSPPFAAGATVRLGSGRGEPAPAPF
jgi:hypothetical protein